MNSPKEFGLKLYTETNLQSVSLARYLEDYKVLITQAKEDSLSFKSYSKQTGDVVVAKTEESCEQFLI